MKENKWLRPLTYVTGLVNQELLLQNELSVIKTSKRPHVSDVLLRERRCHGGP